MASSPDSPQRRRPLLAGGERLTEKIERGGGGGPKTHPRSIEEAVKLLAPQLEQLQEGAATTPTALRGARVVFEATVSPNYLANSYFPKDLFAEADLIPVGTRGATGEYRTPKKVEQRETKTYLLAGDEHSIAKVNGLLHGEMPGGAAAKRAREALRQFEAVRLVELDLGTMSHRRLKAKAAGYGEYAQRGAWRQRNAYCPPLLFITTSEKRARSFLAAADREIDSARMLVACVGLARDLRRYIAAPEWMVGDAEQATNLLGILRAARRPYDEANESEEARRREEEAERERLRSDPEALAECLRQELRYAWGDDQLGRAATDALRLSVESEDGLSEVERAALKAVGGMLAEPLAARLADREPTPSEREALAALVAHHHASQIERLNEGAKRFGEGPKLRRRRRLLEDGDLLGTDSLAALTDDAEQDRENAAEQDRLREDYLRWRETKAARLGERHGFVARHRIGHDAFSPRPTERRCGSARAARRSSIPTPTANTAPLGATLPPTAIFAGPEC